MQHETHTGAVHCNNTCVSKPHEVISLSFVVLAPVHGTNAAGYHTTTEQQAYGTIGVHTSAVRRTCKVVRISCILFYISVCVRVCGWMGGCAFLNMKQTVPISSQYPLMSVLLFHLFKDYGLTVSVAGHGRT